MATSRNWSGSTKEHSNFARLCRLLIDGGTLVVKDVFDSIHPPKSLQGILHNPSVHNTLKHLRNKRVLNTHQWNKLYPSIKSSVTSSSFDITLLIVLLRNICSLTPPATGWDKPPVAADTSREADLARIKLYRNELYGHITSTSISDGDYEKYWNEIEALLSRLSASRYQEDIKRLKVETMEPEDEKHFVKAIEEWEKMEQTIISKLEEIKNMLKSTFIADDSRCKDYTKKLKSSINNQTDFQPGLKKNKRIRTDDIFTNVTIRRGQKPLKKQLPKGGIGKTGIVDEGEGEDDGKDDEGDKKAQNSSAYGHSVLKKCSELFTFPVDSDDQVHKTCPKSILVTGQAGIGKTLFCQKLVRDWANDRLFEDEEMRTHPDFQFVFLLTFRQLSLLGQEKFSLLELLNRSSLLNEQSNMDDAVFENLLQNPEKLLLIIDGYDEYLHDGEVTGDSEMKYPNNPREKMPVSVVVAKLLKGKMLQNSVVMITSRPGNKIHDLRGNFDVQVEVTGFSSRQVLEFVEKYFKDNESMKKTVLNHFHQHEGVLEFVHVPVICLLMCYFLEWHLIHSETPVQLPVTRTDLYHEVTKVFIRKHHLHLKYAKKEQAERAVEETLRELAKLAAKLLEKRKYIFDEEDLSQLKFDKKEMDSLKTSGVLYCCPGTRKSPFAEVSHEYAFIHLTVQEYLAAYCFVEKRQIPKNGRDVVLQFMSGLIGMKRDEELMAELLSSMISEEGIEALLIANCLYEYKDTDGVKRFIIYLFDFSCNAGLFSFDNITDANSVNSVTFVLDVITSLHKEQLQCSQPCDTQPFNVETFSISNSLLTAMGVRRITRSLTNVWCTVTSLYLLECDLKDDCVGAIADLLVSGKLFDLNLNSNHITDEGVPSISKSLKSENCKLTRLNLCENEITDKGVPSICESLTNENCKLAFLNLGDNGITDKGVPNISESLINKNCKLTILFLCGNEITDKGVPSICESLINEDCKLTFLNLHDNQITDEGVISICKSLTNENCKLTSLYLSANKITDKGVHSICKSLTNRNCKLTTLYLGENKITDKGVHSITESLRSENCKLTSLHLDNYGITDDGIISICEWLTNENCKLTSLNFMRCEFTDKGITNIYQSVIHENCKLSELWLSINRIPASGFSLEGLIKEKKPHFNLHLAF
ncbi:NACHT, LRR and PYD domains-containing protein 12-like [Actinia tenebrosa]|uniref:NACHT, LRR and PYD domains-containing protein 12-like n=1 Tax=Actinia tenebrosa TaxID=6105 RepID=A0A6P8HPC5_ACTTE|nr:NACHT, LRR and PYD domains-containing protein 12-like [Actinia tenebrosa]XP_031556909.1 NACHT, LRR and PYD domains-containing protein 12-like [Actinia tenebrosa]